MSCIVLYCIVRSLRTFFKGVNNDPHFYELSKNQKYLNNTEGRKLSLQILEPDLAFYYPR